MPKIIDVPGQGQVEFPDDMSDDQIVAAIQRNSAPAQSQRQAPNSALMAANSANKAIAAVPDAILNAPNQVMNLGRAAFGTAATALGRPDLAPEAKEDPNFTRALFEKVGFIKPELDPQTNGQRVLDKIVQGSVAGAISPAAGARQALTNVALGGASGAAAGLTKEATGSDALAMAAGIGAVPLGARAIGSAKNKLAATELRRQQNAVRDQTIQDARGAGYVLSPSETNPSGLNNTLEGIAGKLSTRQLASQRNQDVTNNLARKSVGVSENVPLSPQLMQQLRRDAYSTGYAPLETAGPMRPGAAYRRALDSIEQKYTGASRSFPEAVSDDVKKMIDGLRVRTFDSGDAVKMTQILRDDASKSFAGGNAALGRAQRDAAKAIEDQIEMSLTGMGKSGSKMLSDFRGARQQMAKTFSLEKAIHEGTGNVQASKLAAELRKGKPLTGEQATIARTADSFPKNMQSPEVMGAVPGISPLDVFGGTGLGAAGAALTGSPVGALAAVAPAIRPITRAGLLSERYQNSMGNPVYKNSALAKLLAKGDVKNPAANQALLAAILANQQGE